MHKENNNNIIYSTILLPELPSNAILESTPERNQHNQRCLHSACVFFAHKKYFRSFVKLRLNHWCHMDYFTDVLAMFLDLGTLQLHCCLWRVRELSDLIKNILICVPKMNEGLTGLERHEWVFNDRIFNFGWTNHLSGHSHYALILLMITTWTFIKMCPFFDL